jgi:hypothetical protein
MMNGGHWFGMSGMGAYWLVPVLIAAVVIVVFLLAKRRSAGGS